MFEDLFLKIDADFAKRNVVRRDTLRALTYLSLSIKHAITAAFTQENNNLSLRRFVFYGIASTQHEVTAPTPGESCNHFSIVCGGTYFIKKSTD